MLTYILTQFDLYLTLTVRALPYVWFEWHQVLVAMLLHQLELELVRPPILLHELRNIVLSCDLGLNLQSFSLDRGTGPVSGQRSVYPWHQNQNNPSPMTLHRMIWYCIHPRRLFGHWKSQMGSPKNGHYFKHFVIEWWSHKCLNKYNLSRVSSVTSPIRK